MGKGGGGPTNVTSTTSSMPPSYLMPFIKDYLSMIGQDVTGTQIGKTKPPPTVADPFPNQQVAGFNPNELAALQMELGIVPGQAALGGAAGNEAYNTLAGTYLNPASNPALAAYANAATQGLVNNYQAAVAPSEMSKAALSGAFGGSSDAEARALNQYDLGQNIGNTEANIYEPAYQAERQNQLSTLGQLANVNTALRAPGETALQVGGLQQEQQQQELNAAYQNAYQQANWPFELASFFGNALGPADMGAGRSTTTGPNPYATTGGGGLQGAIGGGLTGAGIGSKFGPWGALIGGGIGALGGAFS